MGLGCPKCGTLLTGQHAEDCDHPVALRHSVVQKLEMHIALKDASPGFHLSDPELAYILRTVKNSPFRP